MNVKYFAALTAIVLATGFRQPLTQAQDLQVVLTSMFNDVLVQRSPLNPNLSRNSDSPPPVDGRPDGRVPAGTRAAQQSRGTRQVAKAGVCTPLFGGSYLAGFENTP